MTPSATKKLTTVAIHDTGKGIPKKNLPRVFEPFFTTKGPDDKHQNYGLGLSYCQTIVKKHGGKIDITSEENRDTSVFLSLPSAKAGVKSNI
ncbi:MAG TPA: ATP-binding protein [Bacillota bacterium]